MQPLNIIQNVTRHKQAVEALDKIISTLPESHPDHQMAKQLKFQAIRTLNKIEEIRNRCDDNYLRNLESANKKIGE